MLGHVHSKRSIALSFVIFIAFIAQFTVGIGMTHAATAHAATASYFKSLKTTNLPQGCTDDGKTDYPGAIDCILNPNIFNCTIDPQFPGKCA